MDEFKFRAWDKLTKKWIAKDFTLLGETGAFDIIYQYLLYNLCGKEVVFERLNDVVIQLSYGKKDINNNLIYQGDFIKDTCKHGSTYQVVFGEYEANTGIDVQNSCHEHTHTFDGWHLKPISYTPTDGETIAFIGEPEDYEIIGNEMENPDLLN